MKFDLYHTISGFNSHQLQGGQNSVYKNSEIIWVKKIF